MSYLSVTMLADEMENIHEALRRASAVAGRLALMRERYGRTLLRYWKGNGWLCIRNI